jgi:serine/threonine-protein kinase
MNIPAQIDKYTLIKRLGGGSFGEVYLAHDQAIAANTAIKLVKIDNPSNISSLLQEAQILYQCKHKHVVEIREANVFPVGSDHFLILGLEYLPEGSIESEMKIRWISIKEAATRISHVLSGLQYAHSQNYLHRDIKPGNILVDGSSSKLSDFGLASIISACSASMLSYTYHTPPEHFTGESPNISFDIYAMGLTLFRIMNNYSNWRTQITAFTDLDMLLRKGSLINKIGYQRFIPQKVKRIINKACNFDHTKRYEDALSFKSDLDALRAQIDWFMHSVGNWRGTCTSSTYELNVIPLRKRFAVVFCKNGRRMKEYCSEHLTFKDANEKAEMVISETVLY